MDEHIYVFNVTRASDQLKGFIERVISVSSSSSESRKGVLSICTVGDLHGQVCSFVNQAAQIRLSLGDINLVM